MNANDPRHGTHNGYSNLGCRCDRCRRANTEYMWRRGAGSYAKDACPSRRGPKYVRSALCRGCFDHERQAMCGTESGYTSGCRCEACRVAASNARADRRRAAAGTLSDDDPRHGTRNAYDNLGCRCERCLDARRAYLRARKAAA